MIKDQAGIKSRIELNGGRALLDYENGDIGLEDSNQKVLIVFKGQEVMNFTEKYVEIMTVRVAKEMTKSGIL